MIDNFIKEKLKEQLLFYLTKYPSEARDFLDIISLALKNFEENILLNRNNFLKNCCNFLF